MGVSLPVWSLYDSEVNRWSTCEPTVTPSPVGSGSNNLSAVTRLHQRRSDNSLKSPGSLDHFAGALVPLRASELLHGTKTGRLSPAPHHSSHGRQTEHVQYGIKGQVSLKVVRYGIRSPMKRPSQANALTFSSPAPPHLFLLLLEEVLASAVTAE